MDTWEHLKQKGIPALPDERFVLMAAILLCVIPVSTWRSASLCQNLARLTHLHASPVLHCSEQSVLQALICLAKHWLDTDSSSSHVMRQTFSIYSILQGGPQVREWKQGYLNLPPTSMYFSNLTNKTFYCFYSN